VVVVDRLIAFGVVPLAQADQDVSRVFTNRNRFGVIAPAEIAFDRFAHEFRDGHAAALGLELQVFVGAARESEIGRDVRLHGDVTVSRYRSTVKRGRRRR
jgi:hypothetical protein